MEKIYYLATKSEAFLEELNNYFKKQGYEIEPYPEVDPIELKYLLIVEPISIKGSPYAISDLWKQWLWSKSPEVKLILASYTQCAHACALNLLDLPENLEVRLKNMPTIKEYGFYKYKNSLGKETLRDDWKIALPITGRYLQGRVKHYFKGHEERFSLYYLAIEVRNGVINLNENDWDTNCALIREMKTRWQDYYDFFRWFPDRSIADGLDKCINDAVLMIDRPVADFSTAPLDQLIMLTKDKILPSLFPEDYW
jgi:hypothetical protein